MPGKNKEIEWRKVTGVEAEVPGPGIGQDFAWVWVNIVREITPHRILVIIAGGLRDPEPGLILRIETVDHLLGPNWELGRNRKGPMVPHRMRRTECMVLRSIQSRSDYGLCVRVVQ
jgi:hypothetical protein